MSQENVDTWRRAIAAFNERDVDGVIAALDPDAEFRPLLAGVREAPYRGVAGIREWLAATDEGFEFFRLRIDEIEDLGDVVLAISEGHAKGRASGAELKRTLVHVARFRDGRCFWWQTFQTRHEALEAVGLGN
jgi:ketosteroid isomerase-like protein